MNDFFNLQLETLERVCRDQMKSTVHAHHIFKAAYDQLIDEPWNVDPVPKVLRQNFAQSYSLSRSKISNLNISTYDGSVKFVISLHDGGEVECVLMPESSRMTLCLSSQVGCRQACVFCSTGKMGLIRNLEAGEIVAQVALVKRWILQNSDWYENIYRNQKVELTNLVFMGMGEPLDNVSEVNSAVHILCERKGFGFSKRRISVSTSGHLDGLRQLLDEHPKISVAISLHAGTNSKRSQLMPINKRWNLEEVVGAIDKIAPGKPQGILIQYTMIKNVNDTTEDAARVAQLLVGKNIKVNLIPFNDVNHSRFSAPDFEAIQQFRDILHSSNIRTMIRYSKGQDINAACGQLIKN